MLKSLYLLFLLLLTPLGLAEHSYAGKWSNYFEKLKDAEPRPLVMEAVKNFSSPGSAIDLGAGVGQDSIYLLQKGWSVLAIDGEKESTDLILKKSNGMSSKENLSVLTSSYEDAPFQFLKPVDLVYGSFSIPFCSPSHFEKFWKDISSVLNPNGIIAVNLFGNLHSWSSKKHINFHTKDQALALLKGFDIIKFEEIDEIRDAAIGKDVRWHLFNIIARKKSLQVDKSKKMD